MAYKFKAKIVWREIEGVVQRDIFGNPLNIEYSRHVHVINSKRTFPSRNEAEKVGLMESRKWVKKNVPFLPKERGKIKRKRDYEINVGVKEYSMQLYSKLGQRMPDNPDMKWLPVSLREDLKAKVMEIRNVGYSIDQIAELAGLELATLYQVINGRRRRVTKEDYAQIEKLTNAVVQEQKDK